LDAAVKYLPLRHLGYTKGTLRVFTTEITEIFFTKETEIGATLSYLFPVVNSCLSEDTSPFTL
jgi:hypothetical protein